MKFDPIRASIWRSNVHTLIGIIFLSSCALWAATIIVQAAWGVNPVANAFASVIDRETQL